jgi:hypothetical protein
MATEHFLMLSQTVQRLMKCTTLLSEQQNAVLQLAFKQTVLWPPEKTWHFESISSG